MSTVDGQLTGSPRPESSGHPYEGRPFNFGKVLDAVLIPKVVTRNIALPPGARILWGVIRQHIWSEEGCTASDETLANDVGVSLRQLKRYCKILSELGFLRSQLRAGKPPARFLLWHSCFSSAAVFAPGMTAPRAVRKPRGPSARKNPAQPVVKTPALPPL